MAAQKSLRDLQKEVDEWVRSWGGGYWSPLSNLARLIEEVGELARLINDQFGEKPKKATEPAQELGLEMADILYTLICIANSQEIDLQESFDQVMQKYQTRDKYRYVSKKDDASPRKRGGATGSDE